MRLLFKLFFASMKRFVRSISWPEFPRGAGCRNHRLTERFCCQTNWCLARSALPSPLGKVPQCAHWGGRGLPSGNNNKHAVVYGKTPKSCFFTNCTANTYPVPNLFSHPNRFRRADWGASFPKGEAMSAARQTPIYHPLPLPIMIDI